MNSKIDSQKLTHLNASRHHSDRINYYYTVMVLKTQFSFVIIFTPQKPEVHESTSNDDLSVALSGL